MLTTNTNPHGSKNIMKRIEISNDSSIEETSTILSSGKRIFNELSNAVTSCENIESLGSLAKIFSFAFDRDTRESLWNLGGVTKRILYQPVSTLIVRYQSWVLDCLELFHEMNITNDKRVKLFMSIFQDVRNNVSNLYQTLSMFERQLNIIQSLLDNPPVKLIEEVRGTISQKRVIGYIVACFLLDVLCVPFIGLGIIGLLGVEASILFGYPNLLQSIIHRKSKNTQVEEVKH